MKYNIINLVTDKYDKSIVLYGKYSDQDFIKDLYRYLMNNLDVGWKDYVFKFTINTIDFNSMYRDEFEDEVKCKLDKYFEDLEKGSNR